MASEQDSSAPSPQTTLVIILGASQWPFDSDEFTGSEAFALAAQQMRTYFTTSFGVPEQQVLWLFDSALNAINIGKEISRHLKTFQGNARDVIVYYVGHAQRTRKHNQFYLAIRDTRHYDREGTSLKVESLASILEEQARALRRFYILDCCFAANALMELQGTRETDLLHNVFEEVEYKTQGYAVLCSSDMFNPSILLPDHTNTFFSAALQRVLTEGNPRANRSLSLRDVHDAINPHLRVLYQEHLLSHPKVKKPPDAMIYGSDLIKLPIFPNKAWKRRIPRPSPGKLFSAARTSVFPLFRRPLPLSLILIGLALIVSLSSLWIRAVTSPPSRGTLLLTYGGHTNVIESVAWSPDGTQVATSSADDTMRVWNANTGETEKTYGYGYNPYAIAWLPSGTLIAFLKSSNSIEVRNATTDQIIFTWTLPLTSEQSIDNFSFSDIVWSPDGKYLALVSAAGGAQWVGLYVLDIAKKTLLFNQSIAQSASTTLVDRIAWSPDSTRIAYTDSTDGNIQVINARTDQPLLQYDPYSNFNGGVDGLAWSPDGKYLASGAWIGEPASFNGLIRVCDAQTGKIVYTYNGHTSGITSIAWSPNEKYIASADDTHIRVWDALTGKDSYLYPKQPGQILDLTWSPDSTRIASVGIGQKSGTGDAMVWQAV